MEDTKDSKESKVSKPKETSELETEIPKEEVVLKKENDQH